jgi:hypothetical protein
MYGSVKIRILKVIIILNPVKSIPVHMHNAIQMYGDHGGNVSMRFKSRPYLGVSGLRPGSKSIRYVWNGKFCNLEDISGIMVSKKIANLRCLSPYRLRCNK